MIVRGVAEVVEVGEEVRITDERSGVAVGEKERGFFSGVVALASLSTQRSRTISGT